MNCPICGRPLSWSLFNLIELFELYLLLTFILSLALRYHDYRTNFGFLMKVPQRWPKMFEVIKGHSGVLLTWTMLVPVGVTFAIFMTHVICFRFIWSDADLHWDDVWREWIPAITVLAAGLAMLTLDGIALFSGGQANLDAIERNLDRGEFALTSRGLQAIRVLSFNLFKPKQVVENRVQDTLVGLRITLIRQLRRRSFHSALRVAFGFFLWLAWAKREEILSSTGYVLGVFAVIAVLGALILWIRRGAPGLDEVVEQSRQGSPKK